MAAVICRQAAGHHHGTGGYPAPDNLLRFAVVDAGTLSDEHAHGNHTATLNHHALDNFRARSDKTVILDNGRTGLQWFQHPAYSHAAGQMDAAANLRTGPHRCPGVHHGARSHVCTDIDIAGHQHCVRTDMGTPAHHGGGHYPGTCLWQVTTA